MIAIIEKTDTGFSGYFKEVGGIASVGDTVTEIKEDLNEALLLKYGEEAEFDIEYVLDLEQFFDYYKVLNKSEFAKYIGMNQSLFRQYVKGLANLSDSKLLDISNGLHKLANDFSNIALRS